MPIRSLERGIGRETDIHMMTNHLWSLSSSASNDLFMGSKYRKIGLEKHPFCIIFQVARSRNVFLAMNCIGHPCGAE